MANHIDIVPGQRLRVLLADAAGSDQGFDTVVRHVGVDFFRVDHPRSGQERAQLFPKDRVVLRLELHGRLYSFDSIVRQVEEVPSEIVTMSLPQGVEHTERREFYRLAVHITPLYAARVDDQRGEIERLDATVLDISGGGIQLSTKQPVELGARLHLVILTGGDSIEVEVKVVAGGSKKDDRLSRYRVNTQFIDLQRVMRERIVSFVFREQVDLLKKGVL